VRIGEMPCGLRSQPMARLVLLRAAVVLVFGHGRIIGIASGPNPSFNPPQVPGVASLAGPLSGTAPAHADAAPGPSSSSPDNSPSPSMRHRGPAGQGILVPDMYATFNEGFHAAKSPDVSNRDPDCLTSRL